MDRFQEMQVLLVAAEEQSLSAAAKRLKMSPPGVTRAVAALENRLGTLLLARTTRSIRLTEAGRRYVEDCRRILQELHEAEESAAGNQAEARGQLSVTAPVLFGELFVIPQIASYLPAFPQVSINALLVDRLVNLLDEGMDVAFRIGHLPPSPSPAVKVGSIRPVICAAPGFLARHGRPQHPSELVEAPLIIASTSALTTQWQFVGPQGPFSIHPRSRLVVSSNQAAIDAACLGCGFTRLLSYQVAAQVAAGQLEVVLEAFATAPLPIHLLYPNSGKVPAKVRTFVDHCTERLRADPALQQYGQA